jgi:Mg2+ and Co2+ transporter CorA
LQASQVERHPSRHLLLEINRVSEELEIITDVFKQQEKFFTVYRDLLNHKNFDFPTLKRKTRFAFEEITINRIKKAVKERITDCTELFNRTERLADQNVKLVETYQDDDNKTLLIFTVVTITFLPATFVTGFFGMNFHHINDTTYTVKHFWIIAGPLTLGVVMISLILANLGRIRRNWVEIRKSLARRKRKEIMTLESFDRNFK